jgi:hypothetical protein
MLGSVRLVDLGPRDGLMRGEFGAFSWEARLTRGPVSYGLDPATLYKGKGRIARLILYEAIPGTKHQRKVAVYDRGWQFGRRPYEGVLKRIVTFLERV